MELDHKSVVPLYQQIADDIKKLIQQEKFISGQKLPSEHELIKKYRVNRLTLRKAMKLLVNEDLIIIQRGKGMFVKCPIIQMNDIINVNNYLGFHQTMLDQGLDTKFELVKFEEGVPPKFIAESLQCPAVSMVKTFHRLLYIKDMAIGFNIVYLSPTLRLPVDIVEKAKNIPLSYLLAEYLTVEEINCSMEVKGAPKEIAEVLNVAPNTPLIVLYRTFHNAVEPGAISLLYLNTEYYQYKFTLKSNKHVNDKNNLIIDL